MPNYMLRLAFVGTNYSGWQVQPDAPTIQGTITQALRDILVEEVKLMGCCRTDAGVHAADYVANFKSQKIMEEFKLLKALNGILPKDIGIYEVRRVDENFNARFSVKKKIYLYRLWTEPFRNPFLYPFVWHLKHPLDLKLLEESATLLSGTHDFSGFAKLEEDKNTTIELYIEITAEGGLLQLRFTASHFLRYMVRRLVGAMVRRAEGKLGRGELMEFLKGKHCPHTAPPQGLILEKIIL